MQEDAFIHVTGRAAKGLRLDLSMASSSCRLASASSSSGTSARDSKYCRENLLSLHLGEVSQRTKRKRQSERCLEMVGRDVATYTEAMSPYSAARFFCKSRRTDMNLWASALM